MFRFRQATDPKPTEITLECSDGLKLAAQSWKLSATTDERIRILALHGWMDNAGSFSKLAPSLVTRIPHCKVISLDLPGHGLSDHHSQDAPSMVRAEYLFYVAEALRLLKWVPEATAKFHKAPTTTTTTKKIILIGHSMGAGISLQYAAAFPEHICSLVMLDSLAATSSPVANTPQSLREYVQTRQLDGPVIHLPSHRFYYPTLEHTINARVRAATFLPGSQYISREAAEALVARGTVEENVLDGGRGTNSKRIRFRHDPRLQWKSLMNFTPEQLTVMYAAIRCPTCILLGADGWPTEESEKLRTQAELKPKVFKTLKGSHHFQADPNDYEAVVDEIVDFVQNGPA